MTKLVEGVDPVTNRPNGKYEAKVEMLDVNPKTGEQEDNDPHPEEAVKRMKELPETVWQPLQVRRRVGHRFEFGHRRPHAG